MPRTEDPVPTGDRPYQEYVWPIVSVEPFAAASPPRAASFIDVFERRRSTRELAPASLESMVGMLLFALTPRFWKEQDKLKRSRRPSLSGGALHPISVLLFCDRDAYRINAETCSLEMLEVSAQTRDTWRSKCKSLLPRAEGAFLALVADLARPKSAYNYCESVVWRDAGALLQTLAFSAELFGFGFCPLGILGNEIVSTLPANEQLLAVGAATLGLPAGR